jgi:glycerol-3-phosphate acyltransferase PlsY
MNIFYLLPLILGYVIGSLSPAYLLGWLIKRQDLRKLGDGNLGTTNVKNVLGYGPAIIVAIFDLLKGLLAIYISFKLGFPSYVSYLSGVLAIIGHIYPFYLRFRGGQGMATAIGLLGYLILMLLINNPIINLSSAFYSLIVLVIFAISIFYITKKGELVGIFAVPAAIILLLLNFKLNPELCALSLVLAIIFVVQLYNVAKKKLIMLGKNKNQFTHWRTWLRPLALIIPIALFFLPKNIILIVVGSVALLFIIVDLARLFLGKVNKFFYAKMAGFLKHKDTHRFSSMTFFLSAIFIVILVFPQNIAIAAIVFLTFGDLFAKFFGLLYGRTKFISKTLEGSLAYFVFALLIAFILTFFAPLTFWILVLGALSAAIIETISIFGIDDNFTVGLVSAAIMMAFSIL